MDMKKPRSSFFYNHIATPDDNFVKEFSNVFGIWLPASNSKWYEHMLSVQLHTFIFKALAFDDYLSSEDSDYNNVKCTYKDHEGVSTYKYIKLKYGDRAVAMVKYLLDGEFGEPFTFN